MLFLDYKGAEISIEFNIDPIQKYHTKDFKKAAEYLGLGVSQVAGKGFADTSVDKKALNAIKLLDPRKEVYCFSRVLDATTTPIPTKKYLGIFIDQEYAENLDRACKSLNLKKKEVVETYLKSF